MLSSVHNVELLSPAGDFTTALAAFEAGADAVYCGLGDFSARAFAVNFSLEDLKNLVRVAHARDKKVYVTFNTLVDETDLEAAVIRLADLADVRPDALIVQDLGVARLVRRHFPELALHASTQLVAHNLEGVLALKELGFTRVVLARELSLAEIASIAKRCGGLELECFIHGALCYSISGLCLFSAMEKGRSGNRGKCAYCCRQAVDAVSDRSVDAVSHRVLPFSMKDLRLGEDVLKLVEAGVASLKIEGRMKSSLYVASVTKYYRQILDGDNRCARDSRAHLGERAREGTSTTERKVTVADLETVFSRRTTELYLNGAPEDAGRETGDSGTKSSSLHKSSPIDPTSLGHLGAPIGTVKRVTRDREGRAWVRFHTARALERHDGLQFVPLGGMRISAKCAHGEGRSPCRSSQPQDLKPFGFGISEMRTALSRSNVFEVAAGTDVEVLLPEGSGDFRSSVDAVSHRPVDAVSHRSVDAVSHRVNMDRSRPHSDAERLRVYGDAEEIPRLEGATVYCSMSNAVKRMFPEPSFRPSDYPGEKVIDVTVTLEAEKISAEARWGMAARAASAKLRRAREGTRRTGDARTAADSSDCGVRSSIGGTFAPAKDPTRTYGAVEKALSKLGGTDYRLGQLIVNDPDRLFAPASLLNNLRRDLVEQLDAARAEARRVRIEAALRAGDAVSRSSVDAVSHRPVDAVSHRPVDAVSHRPVDAVSHRVNMDRSRSHSDAERLRVYGDAERLRVYGDAERLRVYGDAEGIPRLRTLRIRAGQAIPAGDWDEIVIAIDPKTTPSILLSTPTPTPTSTPTPTLLRLALPVYTPEPQFNALRTLVKHFLRAGYAKWEASDLATVRMLRSLGVTDLTADWTLYAFNSQALAALAELGVTRFVASPENGTDNLAYLAESGYPVAFLAQQSTPLFLSLTEPAAPVCGDLRVFAWNGLWITTKRAPRTFAAPKESATRIDLSWDPPNGEAAE